jgi:hypothetical protein
MMVLKASLCIACLQLIQYGNQHPTIEHVHVAPGPVRITSTPLLLLQVGNLLRASKQSWSQVDLRVNHCFFCFFLLIYWSCICRLLWKSITTAFSTMHEWYWWVATSKQEQSPIHVVLVVMLHVQLWTEIRWIGKL